jgi:hypothetical protein
MRISVPDFCRNAGINIRDVTGTYINALMLIHLYIKKNNLQEKVVINGRALKEAVVDFYVDISRIKSYHPIDKPSIEKDDAYKAYWLLRRKTLQVTSSFDNCEFINEHFVTAFLLAVVSRQRNIDDAKKSKNSTWNNFKKLLYRSLMFRAVTAQSLELMIEAFFCGCDFAGQPLKTT